MSVLKHGCPDCGAARFHFDSSAHHHKCADCEAHVLACAKCGAPLVPVMPEIASHPVCVRCDLRPPIGPCVVCGRWGRHPVSGIWIDVCHECQAEAKGGSTSYAYIRSERDPWAEGFYAYTQSERTLWTVGFYAPDGTWFAESDWPTPEEAAERVHWLNGGNLGRETAIGDTSPRP